MRNVATLLALAGIVNALGLGDIKHVVLLMQENRSFQHVSDLRCEARRHFLIERISTLEPWPVFEDLPIPMLRFWSMENLFGTSTCISISMTSRYNFPDGS